MWKAACNRLYSDTAYSSFFIPVKEFDLFENWAGISWFVSKCEGAAVTAGEDPVKIRTSQGMNRSAVDLDYPFLFPKKHKIWGVWVSHINGHAELIEQRLVVLLPTLTRITTIIERCQVDRLRRFQLFIRCIENTLTGSVAVPSRAPLVVTLVLALTFLILNVHGLRELHIFIGVPLRHDSVS